MKADLQNMVYALYAASVPIGDWEVYGSEGLRLSPSRDSDLATLEATAAPLLAASGWHLDMRRSDHLRVEPDLTEAYNLHGRRHLFHVAPGNARASIMRDGLHLSQGGTTRLKRFYPRRVHFALSFESALTFVHFQCNPPSGQLGFVEADLDIWRVEVDPALVYRHDLHFVGEAVWADTPVLPTRLRRLRFWRQRRIALRALTGGGIR